MEVVPGGAVGKVEVVPNSGTGGGTGGGGMDGSG